MQVRQNKYILIKPFFRNVSYLQMSRKWMFYFDEPNKSALIAKLDGDENLSTKAWGSSIDNTQKPKLIPLRGFFCWTRIIKSIFWLMATWLKIKTSSGVLKLLLQIFNLWHRHILYCRPSVNLGYLQAQSDTSDGCFSLAGLWPTSTKRMKSH